MQVVVSTSLQTCSARSTPSPGMGPGWPEILRICKAVWGMFLYLLELDQEALEFGRVRVGIDHRRRQPVYDRPRILACIFLNSAVALVNGNADLVNLLAVNLH